MLKKKKKFISVVVPIFGNCKYFLFTILENIKQTCGLPLEQFDLVFLTNQDLPLLEEAVLEATKNYSFRFIKCPIAGYEWSHLKQVDWAIRNADLGEWIVLQHMDTFWKPNTIPWLVAFIRQIVLNPNVFAISAKGGERVMIENGLFLPLHDYAGVYNKRIILEHNWSFNFGWLDELNFSPTVQNYLSQGKIKKFNHGEVVRYLDGCEAIALEISINYSPSKIIHFDSSKILYHPWSLIRPWILMKRLNDNSIILNHGIYSGWFGQGNFRFAMISYISSLCFDKDAEKNHILPWSVFCKIYPTKFQWIKNDPCTQLMVSYYKSKNTIGLDDDFGIKKVFFDNGKILYLKDSYKHL